MNSTEIINKYEGKLYNDIISRGATLSPNAITVLNTRYLKKDETGNPIESPSDMFMRVAKTVAQNEDENYRELLTTLFYNMMVDLDFLPNSPTLMNAGRKLGQLSACFVLTIKDSMESIFQTLKDAALIHKSGGGTGFSFSNLRPSNDMVLSTSGVSSGPVSFMKVYNAATEAIKQGGTRRGANLGCLRIDHPDIKQFITCKKDTSQLNNFNISVAITDEFMEAVANNSTYKIINPKDKSVVREEDANEIFDLIVFNAHATGEPGILFIDEINRFNPINNTIIESCNPCGEQPLLPNESCVLGSINLSNFIEDNDIKWSKLLNTVHLAVRFLDNIIDINNYPLKSIKDATLKTRKIGLGIMGFADALIKLRIKYDSDLAIKVALQIMEFIQNESRIESEHLAELRGEFPNFRDSIYCNKDDDFYPLMRNATTTTIAPTGTLSIIASCSSGIEPIFALSYTKNVMDGKQLVEINPEVKKVMDELSITDIDKLPDYFVTSHDVSPEWHVRIQSVFQQYTNNAVSKTINMRSDATIEDVKNAYLLAYKLHCKGVTIYRDGSRSNQVLTTDNKTTDNTMDNVVPRSRPDITTGTTTKVKTGCGNLYVTVNNDSNGPCEIFCIMGRSGGCTASQSEAISRLVSLSLRSGITIDSIVHQLGGIRCPSPIWQNGKLILSCSDAIANVLKKQIDEDKLQLVSPSNIVCPDCGSVIDINEGCITCKNCGYSKCG